MVDLEKDPKLEGTGVAAIRQRFIALQDLRARIFSVEEEQGMFGFEDANDMDALARLEIHQNTALSASQKRDQIAVLQKGRLLAVGNYDQLYKDNAAFRELVNAKTVA